MLVVEQKAVSVYQLEFLSLTLSLDFTCNHRLLNAVDYQGVFKSPDIRLAGKHFLLLARHTQKVTPRLGMVLSRKNIRLAVNRNRCKRVVRESFRIHQKQLEGMDLIFLARRGLDTLSKSELDELLGYQWELLWNKLRYMQREKGKTAVGVS